MVTGTGGLRGAGGWGEEWVALREAGTNSSTAEIRETCISCIPVSYLYVGMLAMSSGGPTGLARVP